MEKSYYRDYYQLERSHWWFVVRNKLLMQVLRRNLSNDHKNLKILNVGVATYRTTELLRAFGEVTSIEYDADCCTFIRQDLNEEVIQASIHELPFGNESFDVVCAFDVIEHVENDQRSVSELVRVAKENGICYVSLPAFQLLWSSHDRVNHHIKRYKMQEIEGLFGQFSGRVLRMSYFNTFLFLPILVARVIDRIKTRNKSLEELNSSFEEFRGSVFDKLFYAIFYLEKITHKYLRFPFGVSFYFIWQKTNQ